MINELHNGYLESNKTMCLYIENKMLSPAKDIQSNPVIHNALVRRQANKWFIVFKAK